jgi:hypothetical protein
MARAARCVIVRKRKMRGDAVISVKYLKSGGAWSFLVGISKPSELSM